MAKPKKKPTHDDAGSVLARSGSTVPENEAGGVVLDFTQDEIKELREAFNNSEYMIRRKMKDVGERFFGNEP